MLSVRVMSSSDEDILDLMFLRQYRGNFREDDRSSPAKQRKYKNRLIEMGRSKLLCSILDGSTVIGFILIAGNSNRFVGGLLPDFTGKGIYRRARNTLIRIMNESGIFLLTNSVDDDNGNMLKFMSKTPHTKLNEDVYLSHYDTSVKDIAVQGKIPVNFKSVNSFDKFYHISFSAELEGMVQPRLPDGSDMEKGKYPEPEIPRVSFSPSPELCFRAIYANISGLFEGKIAYPYMKFTVYEVEVNKRDVIGPLQLIEDRLVHDAHITLEHYSVKPVRFKKVGSMLVNNTSGDKGLHYMPFVKEEARYHSPFSISAKMQ